MPLGAPAEPLASSKTLAARVGLPEDDPRVLDAITRASDRFRGAVNHPVHLQTNTTMWADDARGRLLHIPAAPIIGTPTVTIDGTPITDFTIHRAAGMLWRAAGWPHMFGTIEVTYTAGYNPIPADIQDAVLDMAEQIAAGSSIYDTVTTDRESVRFRSLGATQTWTDTVEKYRISSGDRA